MENISAEKVFFILLKAREFDAKVEPIEPDPGSNPADGGEREVLEDYPNDSTYEELVGAIASLSDDERVELVALAWLGRGDYALSEWKEALERARGMSRGEVTRHLVNIPLLSDYLEQGLDAFDISCEEFEMGRL
jgi:hypothetical protein